MDIRNVVGLAAAVTAAAALIVGCSSAPPASAPKPSTVAPAQGRPEPDAPAPPAFQQPYQFGTAQGHVPPITDGKAPVVKKIQTDKPYVFITMDDGAIQDPNALQMIKDSGAHPTLFLNEKYFKGHEAYFKAIQDEAGVIINDHTMTHPNLKGMPYEAQKKEICGDADAITTAFGKRPALFRPPFGNYDANTQKAVVDCGMKAIILWTAAVNDGVVQFQGAGKLKAGDIVLMHFRKTFVEDFRAFLERAKQDGLTPVPLGDFLA
ncbi:polysaccharide deacetylase family protein [Actinocrispum wychmicini]|uniref:Peptidoglycan/xylan/chitin deacetylase (PgdA/CDA1 family) n=1 Tax=Actinocrispum wychmicini TaxID=1213861 RepID=A0A4R2IUY9_9PSEU|nr:polysaccharide deacetylase family protein [Actinocrispum wychmicini]TCO48937.1 peptidoglycan/xylan/chitin deacetylase (PgdA/CDA1 family) [Actinocrispum wychmicini]